MGRGAFKRSAGAGCIIASGVLLSGCVRAPRDPPESTIAPAQLAAPAPPAVVPLDPEPSAAAPAAPGDALREPPEPGRADLDPDNDFVVAPPAAVADCEDRLRAVGIDFRRAELPIKTSDRGTLTCGAEQVVEYRGSTSGIRYNAAPILTCTMVLGLARFERVLQEEAEAFFHARVKRVAHAGTYSCRHMARYSNMVSEHSYANAIDLRSMTLEGGRTIAVLRDFGVPATEPEAPEGRFLRRAARRAYDEKIFSVVLTPFFDALHRDHFHLDMARYRVDGTR
jgi:hypothetical protein